MTVELWGCFSVRDHLVPRAFIADVLLYDRLVIPTLPEGASEDEWLPEWDLAAQRQLISDLGELAIPIPWDDQRRALWRNRFNDESVEERRAARAEESELITLDVADARNPEYQDLPYRITRRLLQDFANGEADDRLLRKLRVTRKARPGSALEAVSAYPTFDNFAADIPGADPSASTEDHSVCSPSSVFGWQFFVPESADYGVDVDRRLLAKAMKLATKPEFLEMREDFYGWWNDVAATGMPVAEAKQDMKERIAKYQKLIKGEGWKTKTRYAIKLANAFGGLLGLVNPIASAGGQAFLGSADMFLKPKAAPPSLKVAALFHDARARLGWAAGNKDA